LSFEFTDSSKERSVAIWPPSRATFKRDGDRVLVEKFLAKNGFLKVREAPKRKTGDKSEAAVGGIRR
jgi:hypothetical protein